MPSLRLLVEWITAVHSLALNSLRLLFLSEDKLGINPKLLTENSVLSDICFCFFFFISNISQKQSAIFTALCSTLGFSNESANYCLINQWMFGLWKWCENINKNDRRVFSELNTTFREIYEKQNTASFHI